MLFTRGVEHAVSTPFEIGTSQFTTDVLHSFGPGQPISYEVKRREFFFAQHEQSHSHAVHMLSSFRKVLLCKVGSNE